MVEKVTIGIGTVSLQDGYAMRIRMLRSIVGQGLLMLAGSEHQLPTAYAVSLIESGFAEVIAQWPARMERR